MVPTIEPTVEVRITTIWPMAGTLLPRSSMIGPR